MLVGHFHNGILPVLIELDFEEGCIGLKIVHRDARRALHVDIATCHETEAIGHHHSVEREKYRILRLFHIEFENSFSVGMKIPYKEGAFLNGNGVLTIEEFIFEDIFHARRLYNVLSSVNLFLSDELLLFDVVNTNFLKKNLEIIFIIVSVAEETNEIFPQAHEFLYVDQVPLEQVDLLGNLFARVEVPEPDQARLGIPGQDHVLVENQGRVLYIGRVGNALNAFVVSYVPYAHVACVGTRVKEFFSVVETRVNFVIAFKNGFDGILGGVDDLDRLVTPNGKLRAFQSTE